MDCFACISKTEVSSRRNAVVPNRPRKRRIRTSADNNENVLEVIRFPVQPPLLLIVSEHARGFWLARAEDSHHGRAGFCIIEAYFVLLAVCSLGSSIFSLRSDEKSRFSNFCFWSVGSS